MPATPLTDAINALTRYINGVTYLNDSTLSDAADHLVTFAKGNAPDVEWDLEWDYTDGDPTALGFTIDISGSASATMTSTGFLLTSASSSGVKLDFPTTTMASGVLETDIKIVSNSSVANEQNFRFGASNGANGVAVISPVNHFRLQNNNSPAQCTDIIPYPTGDRYRIRLELGDSKSKVYINNTLCAEVSNSTILYTTISRIWQQNGGSTLITAIRAKYS